MSPTGRHLVLCERLIELPGDERGATLMGQLPLGDQNHNGPRRRLAAAAAALRILGAVAIPSTVAAQSDEAADNSDVVRIVGRRLPNGKIEFGLQQRSSADAWSGRMFATQRFFPTDATVDRWLRSSPLTVSVAATTTRPATDVVVRIVARKIADGRVEFGLRKHTGGDSYSGPLLPRARFFPTTAAVGRWLASTAISVISTQPSAPTSTTPATPATFSAIAAGEDHSCGLRTDNSIACWGENLDGRADPPRRSFTAVVAGDRHSCGVRADRSATCWGDNSDGQSAAPAGQYSEVAAGRRHSCGLLTDGTITCWGNYSYRQAPGVSAERYTAVTTGDSHTCALNADGSIRCWAATQTKITGRRRRRAASSLR